MFVECFVLLPCHHMQFFFKGLLLSPWDLWIKTPWARFGPVWTLCPVLTCLDPFWPIWTLFDMFKIFDPFEPVLNNFLMFDQFWPVWIHFYLYWLVSTCLDPFLLFWPVVSRLDQFGPTLTHIDPFCAVWTHFHPISTTCMILKLVSCHRKQLCSAQLSSAF